MSYFTNQQVVESCELSSDIYADTPKLGQVVEEFVECNVRFRLYIYNERQYLVVRGTNNAENWFSDFKAFPTYRSYCGWIHYGLAKIIDKVRDRIKLLNLSSSVIVTGHSLGGGLAQLIATYLRSLGRLIGGVITFGSLKVWTVMGANNQSYYHLRVYTDDDPVPMVPPVGYRHRCNAEKLLSDGFDFPIDASDHRVKVYLSRARKSFKF